MNAKVIKVKMTQWLSIFEAQAQSGMGKEKWCDANGGKKSRKSWMYWNHSAGGWQTENSL